MPVEMARWRSASYSFTATGLPCVALRVPLGEERSGKVAAVRMRLKGEGARMSVE